MGTIKEESGFEYPDETSYATMVFEDAGELTINLADVKELKFENVPKGNYNGEIDSCEFGESQSSGKPMYSMTVRITEGPNQGRKLPLWLSFSQKALPGTKANLNRIAPELTTQAFKPRELAESGYFTNKPCRFRVDLQEYQGEMRSRVTGFLPIPAGGASTGFV